MRMNGRGSRFGTILLGLFLAGVAAADTLELKDGRVLQGRYLGGTQAVLRFEVNGEVQTFNVSTIVAVTFTGGSGAASAPSAPATTAPATPDPAASAPPASAPQDGTQAPVTSQDVPPAPAAPSSPAALASPSAAAPAVKPASP